MKPKSDLQFALNTWGPTRAPIDKESIELWGNISPELVIKTHEALSETLRNTKMPVRKPKNKEQAR